MEVVIDGRDNKCSLNEDINFTFTGFGLIGRVFYILLVKQIFRIVLMVLFGCSYIFCV